jgi:hypothetical protein
VLAEPMKDGMLSGQLSCSGLGATPLPNVGSMGGECEPLRKRGIAETLCRRN